MRALYPLIRRAPRWMIEAGYRTLEALDPLVLALRKDAKPLPPMRMRARIGSRGAADFVRSGAHCAAALRNAARRHLGRDIEGRVLDFGCGCGRTLRHFDGDGIHGCDVDAGAIEWMQKNVAADRFKVNQFTPPLPWPDATFDLVYSVSIFTHLNEAAQLAWLRELARVLKSGGGALLTVQGTHALSMYLDDSIYQTAEMVARLRKHRPLSDEGFIFEPYDAGDFPGVTSDYGLTFHDAGYIERVWGEILEVRGIDVAADGLQDVVALTKR